MRLLKIFILIILFLSKGLGSIAQTRSEVLRYQHAFDSHNHNDYSFAKKDIHNEAEVVFTGLYLFYKNFVSSQDMASCVFYPSCSTYALLAIKKHGLIKGGLEAFDRLNRCNGFSTSNYKIHEETKLLYDPVE